MNLFLYLLNHPRLKLSDASFGTFHDLFLIVDVLRQTRPDVVVGPGNPAQQFLQFAANDLGWPPGTIAHKRLSAVLSDLNGHFVASPLVSVPQ